jgi:hypothetical protein
MGRPKAEKKSNGIVAKRQAGLKIMMGNTDTVDPKPFNPNFMNNGVKAVSEVNPQDRMMRDELQEFINKFELFKGIPFDDQAVIDKYFHRNVQIILGFIEARRFIYLMCIDRIKDLTINEFAKYVIGPSRKNDVPINDVIDLITELMYSGIVKNHRLTPNEGETGRKDYSIHGDKKLELTDDGKLIVFKIDNLLSSLDKDLIMNAITRRQMLIERMRKEEKEKAKLTMAKSRGFSNDTLCILDKMKKLLSE